MHPPTDPHTVHAEPTSTEPAPSAPTVEPAVPIVSPRVRRRASATPNAPGGASKRGRRPRRRSTPGTGGSNQRNPTLKFRVHPDEKQYFEDAAARDGYDSTAAWLERAAHAAAEQTEPGRDDQLDELINAVVNTHDALRRIGHNMNQVARAWNTLASGADIPADPLTAQHHTTLAELGPLLRTTDRALAAVLDHLAPHSAHPATRISAQPSAAPSGGRNPGQPPADSPRTDDGRGA
ncbi:hypothetical protein ACPA54_12975 [Uniformispora flossi]|uniref:hypothetical protein n=1 Tax=Uniformispora flossi TaxID=3390723 RepID=UPI003C2E5A63